MSVRDVEAAVSEYFDSGVDVGPGMPGGAADNVSLLVSRLKKAGQSISADFPGRLLAEYAKRESEMRPLKECLEELGLDEGSRKVLLGVARDGRVGSLVIRSRPSGAPAMLPLPLPPVFPLVPIQKRVEALDELMRKISENWRGKEGFSVDFLPREDGSR